MENEVEENGNPRLGVDDKRHLFMVLVSMVERLFYLNKFPVDLEDFALSLKHPAIEAAWRLLSAKCDGNTLSPSPRVDVPIGTCQPHDPDDTLMFTLASYPEGRTVRFMDVGYDQMRGDNRFLYDVRKWANRQVKLEDQILRTIHVIKAIVHSCNTVGQYKRVSPELLGFLPSKYSQALGGYSKKSPYPAIDVEKDHIETAMSTLAFASLQSMHPDEEKFKNKDRSRWAVPHYSLSEFPRTKLYDSNHYRRLGL